MVRGKYKENLEKIIKAVEELRVQEKVLPSSKFITIICEKTGFARSTIVHYVPTLELQGIIKRQSRYVYL